MPDLATALKNAINNINTAKEIKVNNQAQVTHSDLKNTIDTWSADASADAGQHKANNTVFKVTSNVSRASFDLVKANPGINYKQFCDLAEARGYKRTSAGSIVTQLVRVGMVSRDANGGMRVNQSEYTPVKYSLLRKEQKKAKREAAKQKRAEQPVAKPGTRPYVKSGKFAKKVETKDAGIAALGAQASGVIEVKQTPAAAPIITQSFDADQLLSTLSFTQAITLYKKLKSMLGEV